MDPLAVSWRVVSLAVTAFGLKTGEGEEKWHCMFCLELSELVYPMPGSAVVAPAPVLLSGTTKKISVTIHL